MTGKHNTTRCQDCRAVLDWRDTNHVCRARWRVYVGSHHDPADPAGGIAEWGDYPDAVAADACEAWDDERNMLNSDELCAVVPDCARARVISADLGFGEAGPVLVTVCAEASIDYSGDICPPPGEGCGDA